MENRLSQEELDLVAEKAAELVLNKIYAEVGKSVVKKLMWLVGVGFMALNAYLIGSGHIKLGE